MRHQIAGKKLSRDHNHRKALRRNLMVSLIEHEKIITTEAKVKAIRGEMEKLITIAKRAQALDNEAREIHARRLILARLGNNRTAANKVFDELAPRFAERPGGYTRRYKLGPRKGDAAMMVQLELLPSEEEE